MGQCLSVVRVEVLYATTNAWKDWSKHPARQLYDVGPTIGKGGFSEVVWATRKNTGETVALKVVFLGKPGVTSEDADVLRNEVEIMQSLHHRNIPTVARVTDDPLNKQLVLEEEMCYGGTLFGELHGADSHDHRLLASIFKQILDALQHTHAAGVVHRDVKPANIMFKHPHAEWAAKGVQPMLLDYGMAVRLKLHKDGVWGIVGTPGYVAPEVIANEKHTAAMDMFACGVIAYVLMTGRKPMTRREAASFLYASCEASEYTHMKDDRLWIGADPEVKDLILGLLARDPEQRLTAAQALSHPWLLHHLDPEPAPHGLTDEHKQLKQERLKAHTDEEQLDAFMRRLLAAAEHSCTATAGSEPEQCTLEARPPMEDLTARHRFVAPEAARSESYDANAADVWSAGVLLYTLLVGRYPFADSAREPGNTEHSLAWQEPAFPNWMSPRECDLLKRMLETHPAQRITMDGIKKHPLYTELMTGVKAEDNRPEASGADVSLCACTSPCVWVPPPERKASGSVIQALKDASDAA